MHRLIGKKKKIYLYIFFLFFLSSIYNFELEKFLNKIFLIKNIEYQNQKINIGLDQYLNKNILSLNKTELYSLLSKYPILSSFKVNKIYPNTLSINLEETIPLAKIFIDGEPFYVGENEKIYRSENINQSLPIIKGYAELNQINKILNILNKSSFKSKKIIEYLVYFPSNRWDIHLKDNFKIRLPSQVNLQLIENSYLLLNDDRINAKIIDLRIDQKIVTSND